MSKLDGSLTASFVYNAEGLRVQKTVNGVVTKYVLHGKNITHLIRGNDELHFFYDASGSPTAVEWNNGTTTAKYAYVKNLQGDIIAIIDDTGAEVVKYTYDAWGTPVSTSGTMAGTPGVLQPFRYREYVYDDETGLYYLMSRYYNPGWCRFVNADTIVCENMYCYCYNSTVVYCDAHGTKGQYVADEYMFETAISDYSNGNYNTTIHVSDFISKAEKRIGDKYAICKCSTLIDSAAGQKVASAGMSTMFRDKSIACGVINEDDIELYPEGTILGIMKKYGGKEYYGGEYDPAKIISGDISHGGILTRTYRDEDNMLHIVILHSAHRNNKADKIDGVVENDFTIEKFRDWGWNVMMWREGISLDYVDYTVR